MFSKGFILFFMCFTIFANAKTIEHGIAGEITVKAKSNPATCAKAIAEATLWSGYVGFWTLAVKLPTDIVTNSMATIADVFSKDGTVLLQIHSQETRKSFHQLNLFSSKLIEQGCDVKSQTAKTVTSTN